MKEKLKMNLQLFALDGLDEPIFTQDNIDAYMGEDETLEGYLGDVLFPNSDQDDNKVKITKNGKARVPSAYVQHFGTEALPMGREASAEEKYEEMDPIKIKMNMSAELYYKYVKGNISKNFAEQMLEEIVKIPKSIKDKIEFMRFEAFSGEIVLDEATGYKKTVKLLLDAEHKANIETAADKWSDTVNSEPIEDMIHWQEVAELEDTARAVTSRKIVRYLLKNENIRAEYFGDSISPHKRLTLTQLNDYLEGLGLPRIVTYEKKGWVQAKGGIVIKKRFLPEDKFIMFGESAPGQTLRTESVEQIKGKNIVTVEDMIAVKQYEDDESESITWKGATIQLPILSEDGLENVFNATVI
ncbi:major capsid protein [Orenia marismortui]|uniref:Major capsid protein E n=1 Tax=Orenia marismortui TaxID=46469 RepID=A0A4R8GIY6_9FIRM|nr:major capsid protein [Orenia marismortui]TDX44318.1 major capsid protein E [Orenia marismortui]